MGAVVKEQKKWIKNFEFSSQQMRKQASFVLLDKAKIKQGHLIEVDIDHCIYIRRYFFSH